MLGYQDDKLQIVCKYFYEFRSFDLLYNLDYFCKFLSATASYAYLSNVYVAYMYNRVQRTIFRSCFSFLTVGSGDEIQVVRLARQIL